MVSSVAKKSIILGNNELYKVTELISPDNLEQKYGGKAPNVTPGGNNLFPPIVPSSYYSTRGERLNIVTPEVYKEMCLNSNPFKPFVICPEYEEIWRQEGEERKLKGEFNKISITTQSNENELALTKDSNKAIINPSLKTKTFGYKRLNNPKNGVIQNINKKTINSL